jgi:hypothetical protein
MLGHLQSRSGNHHHLYLDHLCLNQHYHLGQKALEQTPTGCLQEPQEEPVVLSSESTTWRSSNQP